MTPPVVLHLLDATGRFGELRCRLQQAFETTLACIGARLPLGPVDVVVQHDPRLVIPELGLGGYTPAADRVFITLDLGHAGYALGAELVGRHLQRRGGSAATLAQAPAVAFFEQTSVGLIVHQPSSD